MGTYMSMCFAFTYAKSRGGQNEGNGEQDGGGQLGVVENLLVKIGGIALK